MLQDILLNHPVIKKHYCKKADLAKILNVSIESIEYYTDEGILPYIQLGENFERYYNKKRTSKRFKEIQRLEKKGRTINELRYLYHKDVAEHRLSEGLRI